ncbi:hypothetical protein KR093_010911, partial [Drosophila rubida]
MRVSGGLPELPLQGPAVGALDALGRITGLPAGMTVFADRRKKAAIIIDDPDAICMPVEHLTGDFGVCVSVTGRFGSIFLSSVYCYLRHMDSVLLLASSHPLILGLDANAVSPTWFSELPENPRDSTNQLRGELLTEWIVGSRAGMLNVPSPRFTFDNRRAQSDIDVM